jgi:hypothetical protein
MGEDPSQTLPAWLAAWRDGLQQGAPGRVPALPHPTL